MSPRDKAVFRCAAQAHPDPGFRWFFRDRQLSTGTQAGLSITMEPVQGVVGGFESRLTLARVTDSSYGQYSCLVINALGNVTKTIQLSRKCEFSQGITASTATASTIIITTKATSFYHYTSLTFSAGSLSPEIYFSVTPAQHSRPHLPCHFQRLD